MKKKIVKIVGMYLLILQNIFTYNFWLTPPKVCYGSNIGLNSNKTFNCNLNFSQNAFNQRLFTQHKLEDTSDAPGLKISPDGKYYSLIETNNESKLILSICDVDSSTKKKSIVLNCSKIYKYGWCHDSNYLWYLADKTGDERYQLYSLNRTTSQITNLIKRVDIKIDIVKKSSLFPTDILIKINTSESPWYDLYKINIKTGQF